MTEATDKALAALDAARTLDAIAIAQDAGVAGDPDALCLLAQWRLIGHPLTRDLPEARRLLAAAREAGSLDGALIEIALTANGTGADADWPGAVTLLRSAARQHGSPFAEDLALLAAMDIDGHGFPSAIPDPEWLGRDCRVRRWRAFFAPAECAHIAMSVRGLLAPSSVADPRTGRLIAHPIRTSSAAVVGPTRETLPIQALMRRIAAATGTQVAQGEPLSILHYAPGQQYREHLDTLPAEPNQRILTAIVYLNSGYQGGETVFPQQGLSIAGGGGDMIVFDNVTDDGRPDPRSRHAGLPIRQGAKWAATRWIRAKALDVWNAGNPAGSGTA